MKSSNKLTSGKFKEARNRLVLVIASIILFFSIAEITLRIIKFRVNQTGGYFKFMCFRWAADKYNIPKNSWDPYLFWKNHTKEHFSGRYHPLAKPKNVYRIICLGDSTTQGFLTPNKVSVLEETYPCTLEQMLNRNNDSIHFEVINAGCGGYSSLQGSRLLKSELLDYHPDLLIVWFGINDADAAVLYSDKEQRFPNAFFSEVEKILNYSKFYQFYRQGLLYILPKINQKNNKRRVSIQDYHANLREMVRLTKENNVSIVFIIPFRRINSEILSFKDLANEDQSYLYSKIFDEFLQNGIHVIDMAAVFKRMEDSAKYFLDVCHTNPKGNQIIAETVYNCLTKTKLIPIIPKESYADETKLETLGPNSY